jgi:hypothetical protein
MLGEGWGEGVRAVAVVVGRHPLTRNVNYKKKYNIIVYDYVFFL